MTEWRQCPLLAQSGHHDRAELCPLLGVKRTSGSLLRPHQEAGYTSAVVTVASGPVSLLQSGGVHIRPHMTQID